VKYDDDDHYNTNHDDGGYQRHMDKQDEGDDLAYDELKVTAGVKVIRFDEDIKRVGCARNTA